MRKPLTVYDIPVVDRMPEFARMSEPFWDEKSLRSAIHKAKIRYMDDRYEMCMCIVSKDFMHSVVVYSIKK